MRILLCLALAAVITTPVLGQTPLADGGTKAGFVIGVADLPLMAGLSEDVDALVLFDKPSGRIVEALATGLVSRGKLVGFYGETLPELGWTRVDDLKPSCARGNQPSCARGNRCAFRFRAPPAR